MDKVKIGIPRAVTYYYFEHFWKYFFEKLDVDIVYSPETNIDILNRGIKISNDEMCLSLKVYFGHVDYLKDKCDYILIPRIEDDGIDNQTCTNFLGLYDLVNNLFDVEILDYNIKGCNVLTELIKMGSSINLSSNDIENAYYYALRKCAEEERKQNELKYEKLNRVGTRKVLLVSHPYNTYDNLIGKPIIEELKKYDLEIIRCDHFDNKIANRKALELSPNLYWKYSKEEIGSILLSEDVEGIIFLSSFPCGLDSLVNELVMRKINKPYLNIIIDDISSLTGIETRIESFVDIIYEN